MDDYLKRQTLDKLSKSRNIQIAIAGDGNLDCLAAGLAIYLSIKKFGKIATLKAKDPSVGEARQLYAIDRITKESRKKDLAITVNNAVKNVDKVTYFLDGDELKILVHSLPDSIGISTSDVSLKMADSRPDLIFALNYQSLDHLKKEITHEQEIDPSTWIIAVNTGDIVQKFAQVHLSNQSSNSISELTVRLLQDLSLPLDEDISFNLYSGIKSATDAFSPKLINQSTLEVIQYLLKFSPGKANLAGKQPEQVKTYRQNQDIDTKLPKDYGFTAVKPSQVPPDPTAYDELSQTPIEKVETKENLKEWMKPPKIYRGSKSFDRES